MTLPKVVSAQEWQAARDELLVKEKAAMRAQDAVNASAAGCRWSAIDRGLPVHGPMARVRWSSCSTAGAS